MISSLSSLCAFCGNQGLGVVCNKSEGFDEGDFVVEFFGEVYTTTLAILIFALCLVGFVLGV